MIRKFVCSTLVSVLVGVLLAVVPAASVGADGNEAPGAPMVFRAVTAGASHTCAVLDNGTVKCWGRDNYGQLGDGGTIPGTDLGAPPVVPVDLGAGRTAVAVAVGGYHTCAVLDNGTVKCWGRDYSGQLGDGGTIPGTDLGAPPVVPVDLGAGRTAVAVTAGYDHTCAVLDNGTVKCWGWDGYGQLGDGGANASLGAPPVIPVDLGAGRTATAVTAGASHTCAVLDNGTVKCWGRDYRGQLGDGGTIPGTDLGAPPAAPVDLGAGRTAAAVTAGYGHTCALLDNGTVKCWGWDGNGQLGDGGANTNLGAPPATPVDLGAGRTATAVTAGHAHTCAVLDNATVKCWGYDVYGQLGDGGANTDLGAPPVVPVVLGAGRTAAAVTAGDLHTCAVLDDFTLKCWGYDGFGQLGDGGGIPGTDLGAPPVTAVDLGAGRTVAGASLSVAKSADETTVVAGSVIHYHVTVTNTGNTPLTGVAVSDANAPACAAPMAGIAVGASRTLDCAYTTTSSDVGTYPNTVTVDTDQTPAVTSNTVNVTVTALVTGVEGRVTESPSGELVEGVWVVGVSTAGQMTAATMTDASGRYSLGLAVGTYKVEFVDPTGRHVGEWYDNAPLGDFGAAQAVTVNGSTPVRVDAELRASGASGAITGTVTETGESTPIGGVWVVAVRSYDGRIVAGVLSQPDGTFRVGGLTEGAYRLAVIDPTMAHAYDLFYDDKRDFATGDDIAVTAGAATVVNPDLDPARPAEPDATIEGEVTDAVSRDPVAGAWVAAVDKNTGVFTVATEADGHGRYSLKVPAGSYALEFIDPSGTHQGEWHHDTGLGEFGAATPVTVTPSATERVDEDLVPLTGAITGQVTDTTTHHGIAGAWVIAVRSYNGAMVAWDATDSDGRFAITGLDPVNHRIAVIDPTGTHDIELFYRNHDDFAHGDDITVDPNTAPPNLTIDLNPR